MNNFTYLTLFAAAANITLGILVFWRGKHKALHTSFLIFTLVNGFWALSNFYFAAFQQSIWVFKSQYSFGGLALVTALPWTSYFIKEQRSRINLPLVSLFGVIIAGIPYINKMIIGRFSSTSNGQVAFTSGYLFNYYSVFIFAILIYLLYTLYAAYKHSKGDKRIQIRFVIIGITLFSFISVLFDLILPLFNYRPVAAFDAQSSLIWVGLTAYAIAAHHLFDIRLIIKRTVVYTVILALILAIYSLVIFLSTSAFGSDNQGVLTVNNLLPNIIAAILIAVSFDPLRRWLQDVTDRFLFKKEYEEDSVLRELAKKLNDLVALDEALDIVMQTVTKVLHLRHAVTFVFQPGEHGALATKRIKQIGYSSTNKLFLGESDFVTTFFSHRPGVLSVDDLAREINKDKQQILREEKLHPRRHSEATVEFIRQHAIEQAVYKKLESLEAALVIPLQINDQLIGLIALSEKLSGDIFNAEDLALLETIGAQAISSIQKAKLYEGDQMKSEFVSIASHELLTPISAMEGYLSMILDENMGKIDKQARDYLNKVYTSAKRLSMLVKDILSVSRIEAGRLKIEPQSLDINKMITDTLDQLKFIAQDKKLTLVYTSPKEPLPPVWADPDRTMQVLVNLVSNAIKYTQAGSITLEATTSHVPTPHIKVSVTDTGIGMTKQALSHLFEKFYRVDSAETTSITGTGLGLYISKSIIERMGGQIAVHSTPGKGSTFEFTLPLFKVERSKV